MNKVSNQYHSLTVFILKRKGLVNNTILHFTLHPETSPVRLQQQPVVEKGSWQCCGYGQGDLHHMGCLGKAQAQPMPVCNF